MQQPITRNDPDLFSKEKENLYFDRKSARLNAKETTRHICAFANASGGKLVIGIEDNGEITGFKRDGARDIEEFERAPIIGCDPSPVVHAMRVPVKNAKGQDDQILVLEVASSTGRVIARRSDKAVFLRQRDSSVELDREQVLALEYTRTGGATRTRCRSAPPSRTWTPRWWRATRRS